MARHRNDPHSLCERRDPPRISGAVANHQAFHMASAGAISTLQLARALRFCERRGADVGSAIRELGLTADVFADPRARLPYEVAERLQNHLLALIDEPNFGLKLARDVQDPGIMDPGLLLLMASPTVLVALERMVRIQAYWTDGPRAALIEDPRGVVVRAAMPFDAGLAARHADECFLAEVVLGVRSFSGTEIAPACVRFRHAAPVDVTEHCRIFGEHVVFGARVSELVFSRDVLELPLRHANEAFAHIFTVQVELAIARLQPSSRHSNVVRDIVRATLVGGRCSLVQTAKLMATSSRTLQRRLKDEGTTFESIVEHLRRELAPALLSKGMTYTQVAEQLGYSDDSALHHAMKRWNDP
ncbi:MAG: AraC family transcriptional regulator [Myxococcales bacterium]|nr:AraC family transcriptional regulator [Myxococcales bacterium]